MTGITFLIGGELEIGSAMPLMDHQLADISGNTMTLADVKGDAGTLVSFFLQHVSLGYPLGRPLCDLGKYICPKGNWYDRREF